MNITWPDREPIRAVLWRECQHRPSLPQLNQLMLIIKKEQLDALSEAAWRTHCAQLTKFFRETVPERLLRFDDRSLAELVSRSVRKATLHGVTTSEGIIRFVSIAILVNPEFDKHPEVYSYLSSEGDPDLKILLLSKQLVRRMRKLSESP